MYTCLGSYTLSVYFSIPYLPPSPHVVSPFLSLRPSSSLTHYTLATRSLLPSLPLISTIVGNGYARFTTVCWHCSVSTLILRFLSDYFVLHNLQELHTVQRRVRALFATSTFQLPSTEWHRLTLHIWTNTLASSLPTVLYTSCYRNVAKSKYTHHNH